jgi:hypothetical protein
MRTRIISAFPGTGKSYYHNKYKDKTLDSDSSNFSWVIIDGKKERNPEFPNNYINHIKENIGKYDFIFVSSHKEVREALIKNCIFFYLVYPSRYRKQEFISRYIERGSDSNFIKLLSNNFENWVNECDQCDTGCKKIKMVLHNLEEEINNIVSLEKGDCNA